VLGAFENQAEDAPDVAIAEDDDTGVTNNLIRRTVEHRQERMPGFTRDYKVKRLVHFEMFGDVRMAIDREKQIKRWTRAKKVRIIEITNPKWVDLAAGWIK
jgi:putative endonuclease